MRVYAVDDLIKSLQDFYREKSYLIDERDLDQLKREAFVMEKCDHKFADTKLTQFCLNCGEIKPGEQK